MLRALALLAVLFARRGEPPLREGTQAPSLAAWNSSFEGRITLVDFSATWCPHCRDALADEERLMAAFGDRVQLVIVDVNEDPAIVRAFFSRRRVPAGAALIVDPAGSTARLWRVSSYPTMVIVDRDGVIQDTWSGWGDDTYRYLSEMIVYLETKSGRGARVKGRRRVDADRARAASQASEDAHARKLGVEILH